VGIGEGFWQPVWAKAEPDRLKVRARTAVMPESNLEEVLNIMEWCTKGYENRYSELELSYGVGTGGNGGTVEALGGGGKGVGVAVAMVTYTVAEPSKLPFFFKASTVRLWVALAVRVRLVSTVVPAPWYIRELSRNTCMVLTGPEKADETLAVTCTGEVRVALLSGVMMVTPPEPTREAVRSLGEGAGLWDCKSAKPPARTTSATPRMRYGGKPFGKEGTLEEVIKGEITPKNTLAFCRQKAKFLFGRYINWRW
jgi:hypothetical protein